MRPPSASLRSDSECTAPLGIGQSTVHWREIREAQPRSVVRHRVVERHEDADGGVRKGAEHDDEYCDAEYHIHEPSQQILAHPDSERCTKYRSESCGNRGDLPSETARPGVNAVFQTPLW